MKKRIPLIVMAALLAAVLVVSIVLSAQGYDFTNTAWSLLPPVAAILLALITKEVYSSLFIGILIGGLLYSGYNIVGAVEHVFIDGIMGFEGEGGFVSGSLSTPGNIGILIFLVILGAMVMLMNRAGGSAAFGRWAVKHIKTPIGAQCATILLGILIFVDDYFNCLTVGSVMQPVTDKHGITRQKLSYLIDATAAPVCIIAPISSWAAAVTGYVEGANGLALFIRAIPYNFYAILTIVMMFTLVLAKFDYGPMRMAEMAQHLADNEAARTHRSSTGAEDQTVREASEKGRVYHLVLPIVVLIAACVIGMVYTGGFFDGVGFVEAFSNCSSSVGLVFGSLIAIIFTLILFIATRVLTFRECMDAIPDGFKSMVPAILILTFAWTLNTMTDSLGAISYVEGLVKGSADSFMSVLPAIIFLIGCGLSFATGTSWGTFGILIPIVVKVFGADLSNELMIVAISACMAGAVCGDHCSPISDTTIMASAGAQCEHISHVSTQLPYAITVAAVSFVAYIIAGFVQNWLICLPIGIILMVGTLLVIKMISKSAIKKA